MCTHTSVKLLKVLNVELVLLSIMATVSKGMTCSRSDESCPWQTEFRLPLCYWRWSVYFNHYYLKTHKHPARLCVLSHFSKPPALFALRAYFNIPSGKPAFGNGVDEKYSSLFLSELKQLSVFVFFLFSNLIIYVLAHVCLFFPVCLNFFYCVFTC